MIIFIAVITMINEDIHHYHLKGKTFDYDIIRRHHRKKIIIVNFTLDQF